MANVVSQLIIKLVEQVSGPAKAAERSLKGIENAAGNLGKSAGTDKVAKSIKELATAAKGLNVAWSDKFNTEVGKLALSGDKLAKVKSEWKDLVSTIGRKDLIASMPKLDAWEARTMASLRKVEREAAKAKMKESATAEAGGYPGILALGRRALGSLALGYSGYSLGKHAVVSIAEIQREKFRAHLAGMSDDEIAASSEQAAGLSAKYRSVGQQDIMEHIRKLRGVLGDFHHAQEMVEPIVQAQAVLSSLSGDRAGAMRDLNALNMALEGAGMASNPEKYRRLLTGFVRAKALYGENLTGEDFQQYIQTAKSSKAGLSEDYMNYVLPSMLAHQKGFGVMQRAAFQALPGGHIKRTVRQL